MKGDDHDYVSVTIYLADGRNLHGQGTHFTTLNDDLESYKTAGTYKYKLRYNENYVTQNIHFTPKKPLEIIAEISDHSGTTIYRPAGGMTTVDPNDLSSFTSKWKLVVTTDERLSAFWTSK